MFFSFPFNILYFFLGHVRLRVKEIKNNPAYGKKIGDLLMTVPGITKAEPNPTTGSLLICYDPGSVDVEMLIKVGRENHLIPEDNSLDTESVKKILTGGLNPFSKI
jgi:hypothetical protein